MRVLVNLHHDVKSFSLNEKHRLRLINEFPQHEFIFCQDYQEFKIKLAEADYVLVWFFPENLYEKAKNLKKIFTPAAGRDWVASDKRGKVESFFGTFHGEMISESFLSMLLFCNNKLGLALQSQKVQEWDRNSFEPRRLLRGKKVLIIGHGNIGEICARKLQIFGMEVIGVCRNYKKESLIKLLSIDSLPEIIGEYDVVLNLLPGGEETKNLISAKIFESMKNGVAFFNFGRGTTVDEEALVASLKSGKISFAGLDVFKEEPLPASSELWHLPNVLVTPHSSCCYGDYLELFIDELHRTMP